MVTGQQREKEPSPLLHAAGVVILDQDNRVLLVRHKKPRPGSSGNIPGMYGLPSGIKKPLQTLEMNGVDVTKEETGIEAKPEDLREFPGNSLMPALIKRTDGNILEILMHAYLYIGTHDIEPVSETSTTTTHWISLEELELLDTDEKLLPNVKKIVDNAHTFKKRLNSPAPVSVDWVYRSDKPVSVYTADVKENTLQVILDTKGKLSRAEFKPFAHDEASHDIYSYSVKSLPEQLRTSRRPKVDWWITEFCNFTCDFCWVDTIDIATSNAGDNPGWMRLLERQRSKREEIATAIAESDTEEVTLCGGEPLLIDPLEINKYGKMWKESGKKVTINTNASLLKRYFDAVESAGEVPQVDRIKISLDGADEEGVKNMRGRNASFRRIEEGAKRAKELGIELVLTTMVSSQNKDKLPEIAEVIRRLQPASWRMLEYSGRESDADRHIIEREEFEHWAQWAHDSVAPLPVFPSDNDLSEGCFIIDQHGYRQTPRGDSYIKGDNCLEVPINEIWRNDPDAGKVIENKYWQDAGSGGVISLQ